MEEDLDREFYDLYKKITARSSRFAIRRKIKASDKAFEALISDCSSLDKHYDALGALLRYSGKRDVQGMIEFLLKRILLKDVLNRKCMRCNGLSPGLFESLRNSLKSAGHGDIDLISLCNSIGISLAEPSSVTVESSSSRSSVVPSEVQGEEWPVNQRDSQDEFEDSWRSDLFSTCELLKEDELKGVTPCQPKDERDSREGTADHVKSIASAEGARYVDVPKSSSGKLLQYFLRFKIHEIGLWSKDMCYL